MRLAPLIHTRTLNCDFNSEFLVRPTLFLDSDIKWARKAVLEATSAIDSLQGERWLIIDNGKYRIAGVIGFIKNICQKAGVFYASDDSRFFSDNKGRLIYAFIGVVVKCTDSFDKETLSYEYLWKQYKHNVGEIWEKTYQPVVLREFEDISLPERSSSNEVYVANKIGTIDYYEANSSTDYEVFEQYLSSKQSNFSFCSNLCDINSIKGTSFSAITTNSNIITRMNRIAVQQPTKTQRTVENTCTEYDEKKNRSISSPKKNYSITLLVAMLILGLAIAVMIFLVLK